MQVSFQLAAFLVLGGDPSLARDQQVLNQPHIPNDKPGLGGEVADQLLRRWGERLGGRHGHPSAPSSCPWWRTGITPSATRPENSDRTS